MRTPGELAALRATTRAFIESDADDIALTRYVWEKDGAGGRTKTPVAPPLAAQRMKFQQMATQRTVERVSPSSGTVIVPQYLLVCHWDADIQEGDEFMFQGLEHEVVFVNEAEDFVKHAEVYRRGA